MEYRGTVLGGDCCPASTRKSGPSLAPNDQSRESALSEWSMRKPVVGPRKKLGAAMKVRELVARLAKADPEDIVAIDGGSQCLFLLKQRSACFSRWIFLKKTSALTERDKEFLCSLRVRF